MFVNDFYLTLLNILHTFSKLYCKVEYNILFEKIYGGTKFENC